MGQAVWERRWRSAGMMGRLGAEGAGRMEMAEAESLSRRCKNPSGGKQPPPVVSVLALSLRAWWRVSLSAGVARLSGGVSKACAEGGRKFVRCGAAAVLFSVRGKRNRVRRGLCGKLVRRR